MKPKIIFEDETFLVVNKPPNIVVNRSQTARDETLQDWLEDYFQIQGPGIGERAGIVHRLDKETSGLLLVAKTEKAFKNLQRQFKERKVEKRYLALVHGKVSPKKGRIEVPLSRDRKKFGVFLGGRPARTKYEVKKHYTLNTKPFTFLELTPTTGRTHQIRVHLKFIGYPIVGDTTYAGRKTSRRDRTWCPRQFLHASYLAFTHPQTGKKVRFALPLPNDLRTALTHL